AANDPVVRLWDVSSGRLRRRLNANASHVEALALAPDGRTLALAGVDKVRVWSVSTRELGDLGTPVPLPEIELRVLWTDLADGDYNKADNAFRKLARAG